MRVNIQPGTKKGTQIQNNTSRVTQTPISQIKQKSATFQTNTTNLKNNQAEQKMHSRARITGRSGNNITHGRQNYADQYTTGGKNRNPKCKFIPHPHTNAYLSSREHAESGMQETRPLIINLSTRHPHAEGRGTIGGYYVLHHGGNAVQKKKHIAWRPVQEHKNANNTKTTN